MYYVNKFLRNKVFGSAPSAFDVHVLPSFKKSLMYLLMDKSTKDCAAIDPTSSDKICELADELKGNLSSVLITHPHRHICHVELASKIKGLKIYGGHPDIPGITNVVNHSDVLPVGKLRVKCLSTSPFVAKGHASYFVTSPNKEDAPCCFTGTALTLGGCGVFDEDDATQVYDSIVTILGRLPDDTRLYFGNEQSVENLRFASTVEPDNAEIIFKLKWAQELRQKGQFTPPSTIAQEKTINPFLRVDESSVQKHAHTEGSPIDTLKFICKEKEHFKF